MSVFKLAIIKAYKYSLDLKTLLMSSVLHLILAGVYSTVNHFHQTNFFILTSRTNLCFCYIETLPIHFSFLYISFIQVPFVR